jgi:hypothetical protein
MGTKFSSTQKLVLQCKLANERSKIRKSGCNNVISHNISLIKQNMEKSIENNNISLGMSNLEALNKIWLLENIGISCDRISKRVNMIASSKSCPVDILHSVTFVCCAVNYTIFPELEIISQILRQKYRNLILEKDLIAKIEEKMQVPENKHAIKYVYDIKNRINATQLCKKKQEEQEYEYLCTRLEELQSPDV